MNEAPKTKQLLDKLFFTECIIDLFADDCKPVVKMAKTQRLVESKKSR